MVIRAICLLASVFPTLACMRDRDRNDMTTVQSTAAVPHTESPLDQRIQDRVRPLMTHPWSHRATGVTVVRGFIPHGRGAGIVDYLQPDLTYEITESGKGLERRQEVDGKVATQSLGMHPEEGLPKPFSRAEQPDISEPFEIDGAMVPSIRRTIPSVIHGDSVGPVTNQWTLERDDSVLLRRETVTSKHPGDYTSWWVLKGIDRRKTIGDKVHLCVEVQQRVGGQDHYALITSFLSPEVPGHVVEQITEDYKIPNDGSPWMVTVERTLRVAP